MEEVTTDLADSRESKIFTGLSELYSVSTSSFDFAADTDRGHLDIDLGLVTYFDKKVLRSFLLSNLSDMGWYGRATIVHTDWHDGRTRLTLLFETWEKPTVEIRIL